MNRGRAESPVRLIARGGAALMRAGTLVAVVLTSGLVAAAPPQQRWHDADGTSGRHTGSGVQPYRVPKRYDADPRERPAYRHQQPGPHYRPLPPSPPLYRGQPVNRYEQGGASYQRAAQPRESGQQRPRYNAPSQSLPAHGLQSPAARRGVNDVIDMVERRYGGKVVGVDDGGSHYRVRLLQRDGRVRTLQVPLDGY